MLRWYGTESQTVKSLDSQGIERICAWPLAVLRGSCTLEPMICASRPHLALCQHRLMSPVGTKIFDDVATIMREVSAEVIEPRWGCLRDGEVGSKSEGEAVTVADQEAEVLLTARLAAQWPLAPVVGEEACSARPDLIGVLASGRAWLVDPLDGTANFVAGSPSWAVMVALVEDGLTVASWIWQPVSQRMYIAELGNGAVRNGAPLPAAGKSRDPSEMRGTVFARFLDPGTTATLAANAHRFASVKPGQACAGYEYPAVVEGEEDFVLFWRTLPWDHAPGALLVNETAGAATRLDGTAYRPAAPGPGLLVTSAEAAWPAVKASLFSADGP
jgi:fructose-1,6-bisphosphatase/inositol monophosphatase family enzyme